MAPRSLKIVLTAFNAALYAVFGVMTYLGIFAPVLGVVRFWPGVFIPSVFAVIFGPWVGGVGAAIGIFLSDMVVHGNALLSIVVGVPANFVMFGLIGYLSHRSFKSGPRWLFLTFTLILLGLLIAVSQFLPWTSGESWVWLVIGMASAIVLFFYSLLWPRWIQYQISAIIGNLIGSLMVGFGLWGFSQFFLLPGGSTSLPIIAASMWTVWTFMNQIPFLSILVPPILKAVYSAYPNHLR